MVWISVEYPVLLSTLVGVGVVGFTPALKGGILSSKEEQHEQAD